jgi:hypothetical protein
MDMSNSFWKGKMRGKFGAMAFKRSEARQESHPAEEEAEGEFVMVGLCACWKDAKAKAGNGAGKGLHGNGLNHDTGKQ